MEKIERDHYESAVTILNKLDKRNRNDCVLVLMNAVCREFIAI